jgi:hypothetical protein
MPQQQNKWQGSPLWRKSALIPQEQWVGVDAAIFTNRKSAWKPQLLNDEQYNLQISVGMNAAVPPSAIEIQFARIFTQQRSWAPRSGRGLSTTQKRNVISPKIGPPASSLRRNKARSPIATSARSFRRKKARSPIVTSARSDWHQITQPWCTKPQRCQAL